MRTISKYNNILEVVQSTYININTHDVECYIKGINDVIECIKGDKLEIDLKRINKRDMSAYLDGINTIFECINNNIDLNSINNNIDIDISTLRESIKKDIADNVVNYININIE